MKLKYLLIGMSRSHDEIIKVFKGDVSIDVINNHLKAYLDDIDCLQELTDKFDMIQQTLKEEGYDHQTFDVIKYYLMETRDTFVTIEETDLIES
jgi:mRNA deadenylase 3'-5' endonuclease subunit Ccr4